MISYSIVIPVYNSEKYLKECLESISDAVQPKIDIELSIEVVIVNDGSRDSSHSIIQEHLQQKHPQEIQYKYIIQENRGALAARIKGIEEATGEYCVFLDADDTLPRWVFNKYNKVIYDCINEKKEYPDVVIGEYTYLDTGKNYPAPATFAANTEFFCNTKKFLYHKLITTHELNSLWRQAIKTELLKKHSGIININDYHDVRKGEDCIQILDVYTKAKRILYVKENFYNYRISDSGSVSKTFRPKVFDDYLRMEEVQRKYIEYWNDKHWLDYRDEHRKWFVKYVLRTIKGAFGQIITKEQKKQLISEICNNENVISEALTVIKRKELREYSKLDRLEIRLLAGKHKKTLRALNSLLFSSELGKSALRKKIRKANLNNEKGT